MLLNMHCIENFSEKSKHIVTLSYELGTIQIVARAMLSEINLEICVLILLTVSKNLLTAKQRNAIPFRI